MLKLGKKPARVGAVKLKFSAYRTKAALPPLPRGGFGHESGIANWGMLGNDIAGNCVLAGGEHETMLWNKCAGRDVKFTQETAFSDYSAITGYIPGDESTDQGTDMEQAAKYRRTVGLVDTNGVRHKIGAYLALDPGNLQEHYEALYLFGAVGIGILFPDSAMDQFNANKVWSVVRGTPTPNEGHYIPLVAKRSNIKCVTWARLQGMTTSFFKKYNDESIVYLSEEMLTNGKSLEGFDLAGLQSDLAAITQK